MHLASLYRYPVKGLTPEPLNRVLLVAGQTLPCDRAWAIANGPGRFAASQPRHLPKINFLMLMRDERLATLRSKCDEPTETLTILRDGKQVARGKLTSPLGRQLLEQFIAAYMKAELRGPPKIVHAEGHSFSDVAAKCVHIVNLASVRELERTLGRPVDPLRFRANLYLDGVAPWAEFGWIDREIGLGNSTLGVFARTTRCEATNVDPMRGVRDMALPAHLQRTYGNLTAADDLGVDAEVISGGEVAVGSPVTLPR